MWRQTVILPPYQMIDVEISSDAVYPTEQCIAQQANRCFRVELEREILQLRILKFAFEHIAVYVNSQESNQKNAGVLKHHLSNN